MRPDSQEANVNRPGLALIAGTAVSMAAIAFVSGPLWPLTFAIGILVACILIPLIVVPGFRFLRSKNVLSVYWIVLLGALATAPPALWMESLNTTGFYNFSGVERFLLYTSGGVGGLVGWLVAVGFRVRA